MNDTYSWYLYSVGKHYGVRPRFLHRSELPGKEGFVSIYAVDENTARALEQEGTTAGFKGVVFSETLWIDVDSYERADVTEKKLKEMGYGYTSYDTGGRGVHFGITLDANKPSHTLPYACKEWVKAHFGKDEADPSIYTHLHPFRLPGTIHERTGARKERVEGHPGRALVLPRYERNNTVPVDSSTHELKGSQEKSIFQVSRVMANTRPFSSGDRHHALVRLAYALRDDYGASLSLATFWLTETNKLFEEPRSEEDIHKIVLSIFR